MSFKFNPFTQTLDYFEEGSTEQISANVVFELADWVSQAGYYIVDIQHNLESENITYKHIS